jgi:PAS domain S-box-containing protein
MNPGDPLVDLFDHLPDVYFFLKNLAGQFIKVNRALCRHHGFRDDGDMVGKTDHDFHPKELADRYVEEDRQVMQSGQALSNQVWLVPTSDHHLRWYLSSKMPVSDRAGRVIGVAGVMRDYERAGSVLGPYQEFAPVIVYVAEHFHQPLKVGQLADVVKLSVSQFERRFKAIFQMTPTAYIEQVRIHAACTDLVSTNEPIAIISGRCGFYDQSHFTRRFRRALGLTPLSYRKQYGQMEC